MTIKKQVTVADVYVSIAYRPHINCTPDGYEKILNRNQKELNKLGNEGYINSLFVNGCIAPQTKNKLLALVGLPHDAISANQSTPQQ